MKAPKTEKRESITLYCESGLYAKAKEAAKRDERSLCNFIRQAVAEAVRLSESVGVDVL